MTEPETRMILSQVAAVDNRRLTDGVVLMWFSIFAGYSYGEVKWAMIQHLRTSTEYLMPAHLTEIIHIKRLEYRMMNPSARLDKDDWLSFENEQEQAAEYVRELRASGARSAIEAANDEALDDA
jgi:hypothetical protein